VADLLTLDAVVKRFGGVAAVDGVTFSVRPGEVLGLIGPNGAGKTTLLNCISGIHRPDQGEIRWDGDQRIDGRRPHQVAALGIARTFQVVQPFNAMTVRENVAVGAFFGAGGRRSHQAAFQLADRALERTGLERVADLSAASLTVPDRKRLEVARALATQPRLLLLDEVMAGLNHVEVDAALEIVRQLKAEGMTTVLIEHVMRVIVGVCDRVIVLHFGKLLAEGTPDQVLQDSRVVEAYLGERYAKRLRGEA
jgi:branched-chain amino acid transport system ATP-binding protein